MAVTVHDIHWIASILKNETQAVLGREVIYGALGLPQADFHDISLQCQLQRSGSYGFFRDILLHWIAADENKANIQNLVSTLEQENFNAAAAAILKRNTDINSEQATEPNPQIPKSSTLVYTCRPDRPSELSDLTEGNVPVHEDKQSSEPNQEDNTEIKTKAEYFKQPQAPKPSSSKKLTSTDHQRRQKFANKFKVYDEVECGLVQTILGRNNKISTISPVPLQSVSVAAKVIHVVAEVEIKQIYVNRETEPIETIYYFPVDSNGGVAHFKAELDGRMIQSMVKPKEEARAQYERAVKQNQAAFLLESNKPDIFKVKIGSLKPKSEVKITIIYVTEAQNEKGINVIRFFIPTTVAPRYVSPYEIDEDAMELRDMTFSDSPHVPLVLVVDVAIQGNIKKMESPSHRIRVTRDTRDLEKSQNWSRATVKLVGHVSDMDRDFVLHIVPSEVHVPRLYSEKNENSTTMMIHLIPSFTLDDQKVELIFMLDRSGSMVGTSITLAKKALKLFLHSMPVQCYFNIVGFGSTFEFLFSTSMKYDDWSLKEAIGHAKVLKADLGGTDMLEPLKAIFSKPTKPGYLRQVFVLTDGEVSNTERVIGTCAANAHNCRIFAIGIGNSASHYLVEGMAKTGGGTAIFVGNNEPMDRKILQQLKSAIQPSLSNVRIKWEGLPQPHCDRTEKVKPEINKLKTLLGFGKPLVESKTPTMDFRQTQVPENVPPLFDGAQMVVFGTFLEQIPSGVEITAESPKGPLSIQLEFNEGSSTGTNCLLQRLAAIKMIQELEMKVSVLEYDADDTIVDTLKDYITEIACENGLSSKYTSFIAVDVCNETSDSDTSWISVGNEPTKSMSSSSSSSTSRSNSNFNEFMHEGYYAKELSILDQKFNKRWENKLMHKIRCCERRSGIREDESDPEPERSLVRPNSSATSDDTEELLKVHKLISMQSFEGGFQLSTEFAKIVGVDLQTLLKVCEDGGWDEEVWATALAIVYFENELSEYDYLWDLVVIKARKLLQKNNSTGIDSVLDAAIKFYKSNTKVSVHSELKK